MCWGLSTLPDSQQHWRGCLVQYNCGNEPVVTVLSSGAAKDRQLAHMLRCLLFLHVKVNFHLRAYHIPCTDNLAADILSHDQIALFFFLTTPRWTSSTSQMASLPIGPGSYVDFSMRKPGGLSVYLLIAPVSTTQHSYASSQHHYLTFCQAARIRKVIYGILFPFSYSLKLEVWGCLLQDGGWQ